MDIRFIKLTEPSEALVEVLNRWDNDPVLIPLTRPNQTKADLERRDTMTLADLKERLNHHQTYLIYLDNQLIGEMNYMVDPDHLYKKEAGTAWIGITIGELEGRGKGIGYQALNFLEEEIKKNGLKRIELGVFEFNVHARKLYERLGYKEIERIENFTYYADKMWFDIRMEKYL